MASDDVAQLVAFIFDRFGQPGDAGALPDNVAAAVRRLERGIQPQADKDGGQQRAAFDHPVFAFLLGEGQLHGVDFGERAPGAVGKWWWRKDLRAALSAIQGATDAADRTLITREQIKEPINILRSTAGMLQLHGRGDPSPLQNDRQALERAVGGLTKAIRLLRALRTTGVCMTSPDQPDRPNVSSHGISAANQVRSQRGPRQ